MTTIRNLLLKRVHLTMLYQRKVRGIMCLKNFFYAQNIITFGNLVKHFYLVTHYQKLLKTRLEDDKVRQRVI